MVESKHQRRTMEDTAQGNSSAVLEEIFYVTSKKNTYYKVKLTEKGLSLQKEHNGATKTETIALCDIIGCRCMRSKRRNAGSCACRPGASKSQLKLVESAEIYQHYDEHDTSAYLYIYAYTLKKMRVKSALRRERTTITLRFRSFDKYEDNLREASRWRLAIKCLVANVPVPKNLMSPSHGNLETLIGGKYCDNISDSESSGVKADVYDARNRSEKCITNQLATFYGKTAILLATCFSDRDLGPISSIVDIGLKKYSLKSCPGENRKLLVLLNPKSGAGRGREVFQKRIHPILSEAERSYEIHITKHHNYAREFIRTKDIYQWSGLLMVGGDGIVFEVVNGLFQRPDWEKALRELPLGIIPCGSGNGLAKSIAYAKEEPYDRNPLLISALAAVKCKKSPMDLVRVETRNQILFSFLSVGWGLLADIDIESERLRAIGGQRFTVWSVARLIGLRTYKGKVSYIPCSKVPSLESTGGGKIYCGEYPTDNILSHSRSYGDELDRYCNEPEPRSFYNCLGESSNDLNGCDDNDVITENLALETETERRRRLDSFYSATSAKSTYFSTGSASSYHSINDDDSAEISPENICNNQLMYGPSSTIPALTSQLSNNSWTTVQGEFVMVHAAYQTHLGQDYFFAPHAALADGVIWLLIAKAGITRANLVQFLLGLSNGTHLACPGVDMIPVKAFRIEPMEGTNGHITVDGEEVDYGPLQAEIFHSLASVMTP